MFDFEWFGGFWQPICFITGFFTHFRNSVVLPSPVVTWGQGGCPSSFSIPQLPPQASQLCYQPVPQPMHHLWNLTQRMWWYLSLGLDLLGSSSAPHHSKFPSLVDFNSITKTDKENCPAQPSGLKQQKPGPITCWVNRIEWGSKTAQRSHWFHTHYIHIKQVHAVSM